MIKNFNNIIKKSANYISSIYRIKQEPFNDRDDYSPYIDRNNNEIINKTRPSILSKQEIIALYEKCNYLSDVINRISEDTSNGRFIIKDKKGEIDIDLIQKYLSIFNNTELYNTNIFSQQDFIKLFMRDYLLFGEVFIELSIRKQEVKSIQIISPLWIYHKNGLDGFVDYFEYKINTNSKKYYRNTWQIDGLVPSYYITDKVSDLNNNDVLFHFKIDNELYNTTRGISKINKISKQIHYILNIQEASSTSLSLSNGLRQLLAISHKDGISSITQEQIKQLQKQLDNYNGVDKRGKISYIRDVEIKNINLEQDIKNLSMQDLATNDIKAIYNYFKYPIVLVFSDNSTFNNMEVSLQLYYSNIISYHQMVCDKLTFMFSIINKFKEAGLYFETLDLSFNYIKTQKLNQSEIMFKMSNVFTKDEIRSSLGYESLTEEQKIEFSDNQFQQIVGNG